MTNRVILIFIRMTNRVILTKACVILTEARVILTKAFVILTKVRVILAKAFVILAKARTKKSPVQ